MKEKPANCLLLEKLFDKQKIQNIPVFYLLIELDIIVRYSAGVVIDQCVSFEDKRKQNSVKLTLF